MDDILFYNGRILFSIFWGFKDCEALICGLHGLCVNQALLKETTRYELNNIDIDPT
jgi:hypothetical protein